MGREIGRYWHGQSAHQRARRASGRDMTKSVSAKPSLRSKRPASSKAIGPLSKTCQLMPRSEDRCPSLARSPLSLPRQGVATNAQRRVQPVTAQRCCHRSKTRSRNRAPEPGDITPACGCWSSFCLRHPVLQQPGRHSTTAKTPRHLGQRRFAEALPGSGWGARSTRK